MKLICWAGALALALVPAVAIAQETIAAPAGFVPKQAMTFAGPDGKATTLSTTNPLPALDANNAAYYGETTMTIGTTYAAARSVKVRCSVAGAATFTLSNGSTSIWDVGVGTQTLPIAATSVTASTGTCTFGELL